MSDEEHRKLLCRMCGRPFSPAHDKSAPGPTVRHPFTPPAVLHCGHTEHDVTRAGTKLGKLPGVGRLGQETWEPCRVAAEESQAADTLHVVPTGDLIDHDTTTDQPDCQCGPRVELARREGRSDGWIVVRRFGFYRARAPEDLGPEWVELLPRAAYVAERAAEPCGGCRGAGCETCAETGLNWVEHLTQAVAFLRGRLDEEIERNSAAEPAEDVVERCARAARAAWLGEGPDDDPYAMPPGLRWRRAARAVLAAAHPGPERGQSCACTIPGCQCQMSDGT